MNISQRRSGRRTSNTYLDAAAKSRKNSLGVNCAASVLLDLPRLLVAFASRWEMRWKRFLVFNYHYEVTGREPLVLDVHGKLQGQIANVLIHLSANFHFLKGFHELWLVPNGKECLEPLSVKVRIAPPGGLGGKGLGVRQGRGKRALGRERETQT